MLSGTNINNKSDTGNNCIFFKFSKTANLLLTIKAQQLIICIQDI